MTRRRVVLGALAALFGAAAVFVAFAPDGSAQDKPAVGPPPTEPFPADLVAQGRILFVEGCSTCHGLDAEGIAGVAPSLRGVGAQAADFYVRTGRMPLDKPGDQPLRSHPEYTVQEIDAIVAYIGSLGGPGVPTVDPSTGNLGEGMRLFSLYCAGCHQIGIRGGVVTDAYAPDLSPATATDDRRGRAHRAVRDARVRRGADRSTQQLNSIVRYVQLAQNPDNSGGWGIGNIGPIPEGMVAWFLGGVALLFIARLIGERNER